MNGAPHPEPSRALFTLAGGLEAASGQRLLESVGRIKQASILFDEVVIESGLHVVEISSGEPAAIRRQGPRGISSALLHGSRVVAQDTKTGIALRVADEGVELYVGTDLPRFDDATYFEKPVTYRYVSEYHTGILDDLAQLEADWVRVVSIDRSPGDELKIVDDELKVLEPAEEDHVAMARLDHEETLEFADQLTKSIEAVEAAGEREESPAPARGPEEAMFADDLAEAIHVADRLDAIPALSSAFSVVATERGVPVGLSGEESLGFIVPNFSGLPWEAVTEFREHDAAKEARERLREFESEAAARELPGSSEFVRRTGREVSAALLAVAKDLRPTLPDELGKTALETGVGLVPIVGQYASIAVSVGDAIATIREYKEFEGSWVAAIFDLRDAAADAMIDW